jgi:protoporphyrinogen oxidase
MHYGIVGGGVLGLVAALRLQQRGHEVELLEQSTVPGGLASSFEVDVDIWLERFYHHLFKSDRVMTSLIAELGLADSLRWYKPSTTVWTGGRAEPLDSPLALMRFPGLSVVDRLRTAAALAALRLLPTPAPLNDVAADGWMRRACGVRAHDLVWGPLLEGKFGAARSHVSMAWLWARLHDRTAQLGYMDGGFHRVYEALARAFEVAGGRTRLGVRVTQVSAAADGSLTVRLDAGDRLAFDRVVSTLPPVLTARFATGLEEWAAASASPFQPLSAHCLVLALDRPLTGTYWIGVPGGDAPFLAVVEHTAMVSPTAYGGRHLVYLGAYRPADDPRLTLAIDEQLSAAEPFLRTLNPAYSREWVTDRWSFVAPFAQPIVDPGYQRRIPPLATPIPNLWCASMFHVYPHDRGQNYSASLAERLVRELESTP